MKGTPYFLSTKRGQAGLQKKGTHALERFDIGGVRRKGPWHGDAKSEGGKIT